MPDEPQPLDELLRAKEVVKIVGRNPSTLWAWIRRGDFARPLILNPGSEARDPRMA
jgi:predicted DNA-binding transcriptional regulator AlpA